MLSMGLNMILVVLMVETLDFRADDEFDSLLVCNFVRFFVICLCGDKFLTSLDRSRILGSIRIS